MEEKNKDKEILMIDQDKFFADIYKELFESEGYKVSLVESCEKGLDMISNRKPDLILMDFLVSEVDSIDFIDELKQNKKTKYIPIFIFSELGEKEDVDKAIEAGANRYLIKQHLTQEEVLAEVNHFLNN